MNQLFLRSLAVPLGYFFAGVGAVIFYEKMKTPDIEKQDIKPIIKSETIQRNNKSNNTGSPNSNE